MPINWSTKESRDRLIAAIVASLGNGKLNYTEIARLYGESATYHTIENQFRPIRKQATELRDEADTAATPAPARVRKSGAGTTTAKARKSASGRGAIKTELTDKPTPTASKRTSPNTLTNSTISGRVSKSKSKSATPGKLYQQHDENGFSVFEDPGFAADSFGGPAPLIGGFDGAYDFLVDAPGHEYFTTSYEGDAV